MDQPVIYQICVQGHLDESWSDWLGGLKISSQTEDETRLTGPIMDQAALHGILDRLYAMNLPLISVVQIKRDIEINEQAVDTQKNRGNNHE
jgi:hypothetical protein